MIDERCRFPRQGDEHILANLLNLLRIRESPLGHAIDEGRQRRHQITKGRFVMVIDTLAEQMVRVF